MGWVHPVKGGCHGSTSRYEGSKPRLDLLPNFGQRLLPQSIPFLQKAEPFKSAIQSMTTGH